MFYQEEKAFYEGSVLFFFFFAIKGEFRRRDNRKDTCDTPSKEGMFAWEQADNLCKACSERGFLAPRQGLFARTHQVE